MSKRSGSTIPGKNPLTPVWISAKTTSLHHSRGNVFLPHFRYRMFFIIHIFCASPKNLTDWVTWQIGSYGKIFGFRFWRTELSALGLCIQTTTTWSISKCIIWRYGLSAQFLRKAIVRADVSRARWIDISLSVEGRPALHSHGSFAFSENVNINCGL